MTSNNSLRNYLNGRTFADLHALNMKSDEIMDLLECFELDVIYNFDRLHEGMPDKYSASAPEEGFEFQFDERQVLNTIWCYVRPRGEHSAIDPETIGVYIPESWADAKQYALSEQVKVSEKPGAWLRIERDQLWVHYEFAGDALSMVTLMTPWE